MTQIVTYPDPRLREVCKDCEVGDKSLVRLVKSMTKVMYDSNGCGIAGPQVGDNRRICVIDTDYDVDDKKSRDPLVLVNPTILEKRGEPKLGGEGCLSCPGVNIPVSRQPWVKVGYFDLDGNEWEIEGDGLLGRCLQHEIDHLNGITLFESCDDDTRLLALMAYHEAQQNGLQPGDTSIDLAKDCENCE